LKDIKTIKNIEASGRDWRSREIVYWAVGVMVYMGDK
jgi:hypothetical protein